MFVVNMETKRSYDLVILNSKRNIWEIKYYVWSIFSRNVNIVIRSSELIQCRKSDWRSNSFSIRTSVIMFVCQSIIIFCLRWKQKYVKKLILMLNRTNILVSYKRYIRFLTIYKNEQKITHASHTLTQTVPSFTKGEGQSQIWKSQDCWLENA